MSKIISSPEAPEVHLVRFAKMNPIDRVAPIDNPRQSAEPVVMPLQAQGPEVGGDTG